MLHIAKTKIYSLVLFPFLLLEIQSILSRSWIAFVSFPFLLLETQSILSRSWITFSTYVTYSHSPQSNSAFDFRVMSSDCTYDAQQSLELVRVESPVDRAPLSPPPTLKKSASLLFPSPPRDEKQQKISQTCIHGALRPCKYARRFQIRVLYVLATLLGLFCWWRSGHVQNIEYLKQRASNITKDVLLPQSLEGLHFIPASSRNFHVRSDTQALQAIKANHVSILAGGRIHPTDSEEIVALQVSD